METEKPSIQRWIATLSSVKHGDKHWGVSQTIIRSATLPRRERIAVNLKKLNQHVAESENVVVPGKVLGTGTVAKKFNIAALEFSGNAAARLKQAGCKVMTLEEIMKQKDVRIIV